MTGGPDADIRPRYKREAAERAVEFVESGMIVGLGTGSTAIFAVRRIGALLGTGALRDLVGVPTSSSTEAEARRLGIPQVAADVPPEIDLTIDGADEVDPALNLIKGGGGALLREKIVAQASRREIIVVDDSKLSAGLGLGRSPSRSFRSAGAVRSGISSRWERRYRFAWTTGARRSAVTRGTSSSIVRSDRSYDPPSWPPCSMPARASWSMDSFSALQPI